mmetsp:Transcript_93599/g.264220  ORF Transcript_93599/g.264220 Transcript_93599/m.264220 type:complete len:228 (+) Transcript_93599:126-809(+)
MSPSHSCTMLFFAATASIVAAGSPNYSDEAAEVRAMMEGVRHQTEDFRSAPTSFEASAAIVGAAPKLKVRKASGDIGDEVGRSLTDELLQKADSIQKELSLTASAKEKTNASARKTALESQQSEFGHDRAARFFATHGMKDIGHLLGDELSPDMARRAQHEVNAARQQLMSSIGTQRNMARLGAAVDRSRENLAIDSEMDADEEAEELAEKKRWQAVDALRHRSLRI